jgi:hypothetical protein
MQAIPRVLGQNKHEEILRAHLAKYKVAVELYAELESFEQFDDHVVVQLSHISKNGDKENVETFKCSYLVGTDGAHSKVRKQLGLTFLGESMAAENGVVADIFVKKGLRPDVRFVLPCVNLPLLLFSLFAVLADADHRFHHLIFLCTFSFATAGEMPIKLCSPPVRMRTTPKAASPSLPWVKN